MCCPLLGIQRVASWREDLENDESSEYRNKHSYESRGKEGVSYFDFVLKMLNQYSKLAGARFLSELFLTHPRARFLTYKSDRQN